MSRCSENGSGRAGESRTSRVRSRALDVAVVMPAYNEAEGIGGFVREIEEAFCGLGVRVIVVDDASTDHTAQVLRDLDSTQVLVVESTENQGHGASTLRALAEGLATNAPIIIAVDGDGQFLGSDLIRLYRTVAESDADVVDGVRQGRGDPLYRRLVAMVTRVLVWERSGVRPGDANTSLRAYRSAALRSLLAGAEADWLTPNLQFSAVARRSDLRIAEIPVTSIPRRGASTVGTMWHSSGRTLPSRRFLRFTVQAAAQWRTARTRDDRGDRGGRDT